MEKRLLPGALHLTSGFSLVISAIILGGKKTPLLLLILLDISLEEQRATESEGTIGEGQLMGWREKSCADVIIQVPRGYIYFWSLVT